MIAFITSLRHPENSESYEQVEALLERTLLSVLGQTSKDFVVIVVGHVRPGFPLPPQVTFVEVDFPPPVGEVGPHAGRQAFVWDKGTKIGLGLIAARAFSPDRVVIFDADDFVSRSIVEYSNSHPGKFGWLIRHGLMYSNSRNAYREVSNFNRTCGTCAIVPYDVYSVPDSLGLDATQTEIGDAFGERLWRILGAHREADEWFASQEVIMKDLPFAGAVYHVDTGENHSGKALTGLAKPLTRSVSREFGIQPSKNKVSTWFRALGPRAILESTAKKFNSLKIRLSLKHAA